MHKGKKIIISLLAVAALLFLVTCINILQNGFGPEKGSPEDIVKKSLEQVTHEDILELSKKEFVQLYYRLRAPAISDLQGEYRAMNLPAGIMAGAVEFYTSHFFGPGKWVGKAFRPIAEKQGEGYNIFFDDEQKEGKKRMRTRKIDTRIKKSAYDEHDSLHLVYEKYNSFPVDSMCDELRQVNQHLYIGLGHMAIGGGDINPSPFIVFGEPAPWVGAGK